MFYMALMWIHEEYMFDAVHLTKNIRNAFGHCRNARLVFQITSRIRHVRKNYENIRSVCVLHRIEYIEELEEVVVEIRCLCVNDNNEAPANILDLRENIFVREGFNAN